MIKKLLCLTLMLSSCGNAFAFSKEDKLNSLNIKLNAERTNISERLVRSNSQRALSLEKAQKQLVGIWDIIGSDGEVESSIAVRSVNQSAKSFNFTYDSLFSDDSVSTTGLIGRFEAKRMIFSLPLLSFEDVYIVKIKKNEGSGIELLSRDGSCAAKDENNISLGLDCNFIDDAETSVFDLTMRKRS